MNIKTHDAQHLLTKFHLYKIKQEYGEDVALYVAQHLDWLRMSIANNLPELRKKAISGLVAIEIGVIE